MAGGKNFTGVRGLGNIKERRSRFRLSPSVYKGQGLRCMQRSVCVSSGVQGLEAKMHAVFHLRVPRRARVKGPGACSVPLMRPSAGKVQTACSVPSVCPSTANGQGSRCIQCSVSVSRVAQESRSLGRGVWLIRRAD